MARYRKVEVRMWGDAKFKTLNCEEKLLWCYLLTGPETTTIPGVITAGEATLTEAMGWSTEQFRNRFETVSGRLNIQSDFVARLIFLPSATRHNPPANPNVVKAWARAIVELPESSLVLGIVEKISSTLHDLDSEPGSKTNYQALFIDELPKPFRNRFETVPKPFRIQKQLQKQLQNKRKDNRKDSSRSKRSSALDPNHKKPDLKNPAVDEVLARYMHHHPKARPGAKEKAMVKARLGEGFEAKDLIQAVDSIHAQPFYCGENDRHTKYHKLIHALRNSDTVTSHLEWIGKKNTPESYYASIWEQRGVEYGLRYHEAEEIALRANYDVEKFNELARVYFDG